MKVQRNKEISTNRSLASVYFIFFNPATLHESQDFKSFCKFGYTGGISQLSARDVGKHLRNKQSDAQSRNGEGGPCLCVHVCG